MTRAWATHVGAALGLSDLRELSGGHQSRVFLADAVEGSVVLKLVDANTVELGEVQARVAMLSALGRRTEVVCAPVKVREQIVHELTGEDGSRCFGVCYQVATGEQPDVTDPGDAALMGRELAELHRHLAALPTFRLPVITSFRDRIDAATIAQLGPPQLLHGDFNAANIRVADGRSRIFDFDDGGYGPVEFDLAHALYVVLFDAATQHAPERYDIFRPTFLAAYRERSGGEYADASLSALITQRVLALGSWLQDLSQAPPGIRNSSEEWLRTLRGFVRDYRPELS